MRRVFLLCRDASHPESMSVGVGHIGGDTRAPRRKSRLSVDTRQQM